MNSLVNPNLPVCDPTFPAATATYLQPGIATRLRIEAESPHQTSFSCQVLSDATKEAFDLNLTLQVTSGWCHVIIFTRWQGGNNRRGVRFQYQAPSLFTGNWLKFSYSLSVALAAVWGARLAKAHTLYKQRFNAVTDSCGGFLHFLVESSRWRCWLSFRDAWACVYGKVTLKNKEEVAPFWSGFNPSHTVSNPPVCLLKHSHCFWNNPPRPDGG